MEEAEVYIVILLGEFMKRRFLCTLLGIITICALTACDILNKPIESVSENGRNEVSAELNNGEDFFSEDEEISASDTEMSEETDIKEETAASESEGIESTGLSEAELVAIVEEMCGKKLEKYDYVYVDMDKDGAYEVMATCNEDYVHQIWFCSSDGTVCEMINENTWGFMECMLNVTDTEEYALVTTQFWPDAGPYAEYIVWRMNNSEIEVALCGTGSISMDDNGNFYEIDEYYTAYWDAEAESFLGRSWIVRFKEYDFDTNTISTTAVHKISKDEFYEYSNSEEILQDIKTREEALGPYKIEFDFYITSNEKIYIQSKLYDVKENIEFRYYILDCEGDKIMELQADEEARLGDLSILVE